MLVGFAVVEASGASLRGPAGVGLLGLVTLGPAVFGPVTVGLVMLGPALPGPTTFGLDTPGLVTPALETLGPETFGLVTFGLDVEAPEMDGLETEGLETEGPETLGSDVVTRDVVRPAGDIDGPLVDGATFRPGWLPPAGEKVGGAAAVIEGPELAAFGAKPTGPALLPAAVETAAEAPECEGASIAGAADASVASPWLGVDDEVKTVPGDDAAA